MKIRARKKKGGEEEGRRGPGTLYSCDLVGQLVCSSLIASPSQQLPAKDYVVPAGPNPSHHFSRCRSRVC